MERDCGKRTGRGERMIRLLRTSRAGILAAAAGLVMMAVGISRGEMAVVLIKQHIRGYRNGNAIEYRHCGHSFLIVI